MSVSLAFRFPAGRYHATPFGHHVNEGLIEWPPSPWRLLRALISIGYTSGAWNGDGPPDAARCLIENLASELPCYRLPPAVGAHSRHYMPIGMLDPKTKIEKTTLVFDTWARVEDQELVATWRDVTLNDAGRSVLVGLTERLNYLGRSESWVEGRVLGAHEPAPEINCFPEQPGNAPGRGWEQIVLLAPDSASAFASWRAARLHDALAELPLPEGRKPAKALLDKRVKAQEPYPADLMACLQKDTTWLRSHGWNRPPGSRRVFYWRPSDAVSVGAPKPRTTIRFPSRVDAMLLSLTNASRNDHALPTVTRTLPQAELLHRALVGIASRKGTPPPELTGRDAHRRPLRGPHEHAHLNPLDLDGDGHLDHVLVWAPGGLGAESQAAVRAARMTFTKGGIEPLRLALAAAGNLSDMVRLSGVTGRRIARLAHCAANWQSVTPFVPPRHVKTRGKTRWKGRYVPSCVHEASPTRPRCFRSCPVSEADAMPRRATGPAVNATRRSGIGFAISSLCVNVGRNLRSPADSPFAWNSRNPFRALSRSVTGRTSAWGCSSAVEGNGLPQSRGRSWKPLAFKHPNRAGRITVTHPNRNIKRGTVASIYRQAGWVPRKN